MTPYLALALNNAWSNATLYAAVQALPPDAFIAERPGFFPTLAATLNHIYEVDIYYLDALEGGGLGRSVYDRAQVIDAHSLGALQAAADARLASFCQALTPADLMAMCRTERTEGMVEERTDAVLLHLFQHQVHHRGQAHVQLSHVGVTPPQLDEFFLAYDRAPSAEAYWPCL